MQQILLYGEIASGDAISVINSIKAAGQRPIELRINSPGGSVFEGYAIFNALARHAPGVTVHIDSLAASIAALIAMVGKKKSMAENAMMMIHAPSLNSGGTSEDLRKGAELLDKITKTMIDVFAAASKQPRETIASMIEEETWLTSEQAKAMGFIDEITEPLALAACLGSIQFAKLPDQLRDAAKKPSTEEDVSGDRLLSPDEISAVEKLMPWLSRYEAERDDVDFLLEGKPILAALAQITRDSPEFRALAERVDVVLETSGLKKLKPWLIRFNAEPELADVDFLLEGKTILAFLAQVTGGYRELAECIDTRIRARQIVPKFQDWKGRGCPEPNQWSAWLDEGKQINEEAIALFGETDGTKSLRKMLATMRSDGHLVYSIKAKLSAWTSLCPTGKELVDQFWIEQGEKLLGEVSSLPQLKELRDNHEKILVDYRKLQTLQLDNVRLQGQLSLLRGYANSKGYSDSYLDYYLGLPGGNAPEIK